MKTLVIIPVRDEADALEKLLPEILAATSHLANFEIVIIDDGSSDGSGGVGQKHNLTVLRQENPIGKPQAVRRGLEYALEGEHDAAIVFDGDGQHPPHTLPVIFEALHTHMIVKGSRFHPDSIQIDTPPDRLELCRKVREAVQEYTSWTVYDPQCGLIGLKRQCFERAIRALTWTVEWELEFLIWLRSVTLNGSPVHEVPIPALYSGLPGSKQRTKYDPQIAKDESARRLPRQLGVVRDAANRFLS
jgi:glycosyltransferase involved in cell wall biosynthesis